MRSVHALSLDAVGAVLEGLVWSVQSVHRVGSGDGTDEADVAAWCTAALGEHPSKAWGAPFGTAALCDALAALIDGHGNALMEAGSVTS